MRVQLAFKEVIDLELLGHGPPLRLIRILANVVFRSTTGWTPVFSAIVDTGSPVSVLPEKIWELCDGERFTKTEMRGLVPKGDAVLSATYARVTCALVDGRTVSPSVSMRVFVANTSEVPLILGMADIMEHASLWFDRHQHQAWFEL